jgi:hypothetical protein
VGVFIKIEKESVILAGQVANQDMLNDGYFEYEGEIPNIATKYDKLVYSDNVLSLITDEKTAIKDKLAEYKVYLSNTDFKVLPDYEPKEGEDLEAIKTARKEARDFIRSNPIAPIIGTISLIAEDSVILEDSGIVTTA